MQRSSHYTLSWTDLKGNRKEGNTVPIDWSSPYEYARWMAQNGVYDIKIYFKGELVDTYGEFRSFRNLYP